MRKVNKFFKITFVFFLLYTSQVESKILSIGYPEAKVTVKVFSSLTCPHCAEFHEVIFNKLKNDYIDKNLVKFEHHAFPLDLAALNAEVIIRCQTDNELKFKLLEEIYKKQSLWAVGSDINKINSLIKKVGLNFDLTENSMDKCLLDSKVQDEILDQRIQAQKEYSIDSTPTIIVNEKKYKGKVDYESFKKIIEKNL